ncbi:hypothetical protein WN943_022458 [Citrus x changshan-huyou]
MKKLREKLFISIFVLCAFLSVRKDLRKIIHYCKAMHIKNSLLLEVKLSLMKKCDFWVKYSWAT